jgi:hypothetical protein
MFALSASKRQIGNITLRFEGFGGAGMDEIAGYVTQMCNTLPTAIPNVTLGSRWFGTWYPNAQSRLKLLNSYLSTRCRVLTFVRKISGAKCDNAMVEISDYGQVIPNVVVNSHGVASRQNLNSANAILDVPTGLRIFISPTFAKTTDLGERQNCVFHEITHKVIDTHDFEYGPSSCLDIAKANNKQVIANADNYGYWLAEACGYTF